MAHQAKAEKRHGDTARLCKRQTHNGDLLESVDFCSQEGV